MQTVILALTLALATPAIGAAPRETPVASPSKTPITDALRQHITPFMLHPIRTMECPETEKETAGAFQCRGMMIDGQSFVLSAERQPSGVIDAKFIDYEGPEIIVRDFITPWMSGTLKELDCPDTPEATARDFVCQGSTSDGSVFTVEALAICGLLVP